MQLENDILLQKYSEEIKILKKVLLNKYDGISDAIFIEILKFIFINKDLVERDIEIFSENILVNVEVVKFIFESFKNSSKVNILNFEFPKSILPKSKFSDDINVVDFILEKIKSVQSNITIFDDLNVIDLISTEAINELNDFIQNFLINGKIKHQIEHMKDELMRNTEYRLAEVKVKALNVVHHLKDHFKLFENYHKCYVKIIYPFVTIHDRKSLKEIMTTRIDYLEIKYV